MRTLKLLVICCLSLSICGCNKVNYQSEDEVISIEKDDSKTNIESVVNEALKEQDIKADYMVREIDKQTMYITDNILGYDGPNEADFKEKINLTENQEIQVIGVVEQYKNESCLWYLLEGNTFVNGGYVSDKPIIVESSGVDSKGVSIELGEDEYKGDEEISETLSVAEKNAKEMLDGGFITEEEYNDLIENHKRVNSGESNTSTNVNITVDESKMPPSTTGIETGAPAYGEVNLDEIDASDAAGYRID